MQETLGEVQRGGGRWWDDPRLSLALMITTYVFAGIGIGIGIYFLTGSKYLEAARWSMLFMVGVVGILSMLRHSIFWKSDTTRAGAMNEPFYIMELGFANGAMGVLAFFAFFGRWGVGSAVVLSLTYALYLFLALVLFVVRTIGKGVTGLRIFTISFWFLQVAFLATFAIVAAVHFRLSPF
jgi:hypothetical protein